MNPVDSSNNVVVVQGMDYHASDTRSLFWTVASSNEWPDLTSATITLAVYANYEGDADFSKAGSVTTPTGTQVVAVALAAAETAALDPGGYLYILKATLSSARVVELRRGSFEVQPPGMN